MRRRQFLSFQISLHEWKVNLTTAIIGSKEKGINQQRRNFWKPRWKHLILRRRTYLNIFERHLHKDCLCRALGKHVNMKVMCSIYLKYDAQNMENKLDENSLHFMFVLVKSPALLPLNIIMMYIQTMYTISSFALDQNNQV